MTFVGNEDSGATIGRRRAELWPDVRRSRARGVSAVTVSRALRHPEMVSAEIAQARRKGGARTRLCPEPRWQARLPRRAPALIGVVVSSLTNGVFADYLRALHDMLPAARASRCMVLN